MHQINLETWKRRDHYRHFCSLDDPYWGISTALDCAHTLRTAKLKGESFFLSYLHKSLIAANRVEELRLRIVDGQVVCYDKINGSATVLRPDETFGCCYIEYFEDFQTFASAAAKAIEQTKACSGMCIDQNDRADQIYYSSIPWQHFTGLTYSKSLNSQDSVPRITFGKVAPQGRKQMLPVSIQVHHGLVDGLHVARFLEHFQELLNAGAA
ncbi:MAG TPA: chloramphenicol acetyltransferase [Candidatus Rifleibacterium sp.]|nr:chloramphenicol acetyltransferase [Candidatus Rifleibacterium sp.]HPT45575.1 chloramphenicol acetyltransferase [Candidatus Rifleibacterium sp.]